MRVTHLIPVPPRGKPLEYLRVYSSCDARQKEKHQEEVHSRQNEEGNIQLQARPVQKALGLRVNHGGCTL